MAQITDNKAAWIPYEKSKNMEVGPGPVPNPDPNEVVIKVFYAAVNPADWKTQDSPFLQLPYPFILGTDVSGTVAQLGSDVTRFTIGQRIIGHCISLLTQKATNAGFQLYTTCREILVAAIPESVPLANAAVLPLSISTAATGLFKHLKLPFPSLEPKPTGKTVLIWGGSSSVGSSAIQLATAAGLTVATTASVKNHEYVKSLGATYAFDHADPKVIDKIMKVMKKGDVVFDVISSASAQKACMEIVNNLGGGILPIVLPLVIGESEIPEGVEIEMVIGPAPGMTDLDIGDAVWRKYIPQALAAGKFLAKPDPMIVEGGLEKVQEGIDVLRKGVSANKVVIEIAKET